MISDDARLALMLHEEEMKAARGTSSFSRMHSRGGQSKSLCIAESSDKQHPTQHPTSSKGKQKGLLSSSNSTIEKFTAESSLEKAGNLLSEKGHSKRSTSRCTGAHVKMETCPKISKKQKIEHSSISHQTKVTANPKSVVDEKVGMVSFIIIPEESDGNSMPKLKRSKMCLMEDLPVGLITRTIIEEVFPDKSATDVIIRTASGMLVGQDHSLRFVRTFLWPRSKGELVLKYSLSKPLLL